jgi:glycosyltransferase involved in cell wall biosynthesis
MKVSIVTISFNQVRFLERALRSVLDQDYPDIEYIVVDPGSTDGSLDLIARYRDRLALYIDSPDRGPADGLNKGFAHATGDVFGYVNADDALLPGAIREAAAEFRVRPDVDVVSGHGYVVDGAGRCLHRIRSGRYHPWLYAYGGVMIIQPSTFFRAEAFRRAGGFNPLNRTSWDGELMVDLARTGARFAVVNRYWSLFTVHDQSISGTGRLRAQYLADARRLSEKALGRALDPFEGGKRALARLCKWARDPVAPAQRILDLTLGCPQVELP